MQRIARMWIILVDHSSSMAGPFSNFHGYQPDERLARYVEAETRLEGAKEALLEQLGRLPADMPVALFGFTETVQHLLTASAGTTEHFRRVLSLLEPEDGTDIAAAINTAADYFEKLSTRPHSARV